MRGRKGGLISKAVVMAGLLMISAAPAFAAVPVPQAQAARFLAQATFGPTQAEIDAVVAGGPVAWLNQQFSLEPSLHRPEIEFNTNLGGETDPPQSLRQEMWWRMAVTAPDQLRQRVAFALSEIFVVSDQDPQLNSRPLVLAEYYDILLRGAFGNYRDLLENVTLSPAMGVYLSMIMNNKPDPKTGRRPDENFARENMQLFSIGLWHLNEDGSYKLDGGRRIPTYTQAQVENFARAYTGWGWADGSSLGMGGNSYAPMKAYEDHHDTDAKELIEGVTLPAGQSAAADLDAALDVLFNHPNVGPFIARQLIQRLVSSNPSPAYVQRVAHAFNNNGAGVRGDLKAVIFAILMDEEARRAPANDAGKLREPLLHLTAVWRAFGAGAGNRRYYYDNPEAEWGQAALRAPSVFNFFSPDYQAPGLLAARGRYSPEFQIQNESRSVTIVNAWTRFVRVQSGCRSLLSSAPEAVMLDLCTAMDLAADPAALVDQLDLLLLSGQMPQAMRDLLLAHVQAIPADDTLRRAREALFLVVASPQFAVQK